jgi:RNA polymerase sigma-70 factor (ECF subfamily)
MGEPRVTIDDTSQDLEQAIRQARLGDRETRGALLEQYRNYLTLLARLHINRRLQGKVDAADLIQETFLKAHRSFSQFRGQSEKELAAWLRQILGNTLANLVRHYYKMQRRDVRLERALTDELDASSMLLKKGLATGDSTPSQRASKREQAVLLADALKQLPESYQEVLVLRHLEELTFPQVAVRIGRSTGAVEKLWIRALARLRVHMGGPAS